MKKLIDYDQKEVEHRVKYYDFYQITSYLLFALLIWISTLWLMEKDSAEYNESIIKMQNESYINALQEQKLSIDSALWYKEMGVKIENNFDN